MSLQPANEFLRRLNRTILILGLSTFLVAALILSFVSRTITHPLDELVAGVRALAHGDYAYTIKPGGSSEVAELGDTFSKMRGELLLSEQRRFATERIAAFGRAASSISHDLRHYLAAVVANAEFLADFFDDLGEGRIVYVRDLVEQVMFHLEIQAAQDALSLAQRQDPDAAAENKSLVESERRLLDRVKPAPDKLLDGVDLFPLPGYTPGQSGLLISLPTRTVMIAGDAVPSAGHFAAGQVFPDCFDLHQAQESLVELYEIADLIIPGHDNIFVNPRSAGF